MSRQIILIHGGETFASYEEYLEYLKTRAMDLERMKPWTYWKTNLQETLGDDYEVLLPRMPNQENAKYAAWKIVFERILPLLNDEVIFVGHSLGGIFLAKYFAENDCPKKIRGIILIAVPFEEHENESLADFTLPQSLEKFSTQAGRIALFHSKDDPVVPFADFEKYHAVLPSAETHVLDGCGHFLMPEFPELVQVIKDTQ